MSEAPAAAIVGPVPQAAPRDIVQIAVTTGVGRDVVFALARDGTLWRLAVKQGHQTWLRVAPIPDTTAVPTADTHYPGAP